MNLSDMPMSPNTRRRTENEATITADSNDKEREASPLAVHILLIPSIVRKIYNYFWLVRSHPNLRSTLLLQVRYLAELFLAYKYCFGGYEKGVRDSALKDVLNPAGAIAGMISAAVGLLRVIESAPSS
ncbi:unnamed protein product [Phytomonas sp. Hart1]|nr:unnamed protein product [Phytomonas sp. Hart1]|eukprot:CCW71369.1 unnamed protein product [Phytomonas sp. isolate Hart1]